MVSRARSVRLRTYNLGFGDCLLLTVSYRSDLPDGRRERHMLIDCGTHEYADDGPDLPAVATTIAEHTGGRLDVVVATHRHDDHLGGFGHAAARTTLDQLRPAVVIRPWTDVPPAMRLDETHRLTDTDRRFLSLLDGVQDQAASIETFPFDNDRLARRAKELASLGHKNGPAIAALEQWAETGRGHYVRAGDIVDVKDVMPGVRIEVLGPPTLDQVPRLTSYAKSSEEYWLHLAAASELQPVIAPDRPDVDAAREARRVVAGPEGAGAASWLVRTLNDRPLTQGLDIVEGFDDVLNNTSVVLLVTVGERSLLLAGDAQAENWSYTLDRANGTRGRRRSSALRRRLAEVDVYKVGHHGSRNASPRSLVALWQQRDTTARPLTSILTTKAGVFEKSAEGRVPNDELVTELAGLGSLHRTDELPADVWWFDIEAETAKEARFTYTAGPPRPSR